MALNHRRLSVRVDLPFDMGGNGYLAGSAPASDASDAPDGRFKILNVPSIGRVVALERSTFRMAGSTLSKADGTWRIEGLARDKYFLVMGFDDRGRVNAAIQDWVKPAVAEL